MTAATMEGFEGVNDDTFLNYSSGDMNGLMSMATVSLFNNGVGENRNTTEMYSTSDFQKVLTYVNVVCYLLICAFGLVGNGLVIFVILMYAKMKIVTNMYILNLAVSDMLFLTALPITATTVIMKHWVFGLVICKIYFVLYAINIFGGTFTLCVMSADRYLAVCRPIQSVRYRTPRVAMWLCLCVWLLSFLVSIPLILYTTLLKHHTLEGKYSCNMDWPGKIIPIGTAFIWYSFVIGFLVPVMFITVFYVLIIIRLRRLGSIKKSKENRRTNGRVTRLIFAVVTVYVVCWLPFWCFQIHTTFQPMTSKDTNLLLLINCFTALSYSNSMLNPILYAFLSENFRQSFAKAFKCMTPSNVRSLSRAKEALPCTNESYLRSGPERAANHEMMELSAIDHISTESQSISKDNVYSKGNECERGFLKP